MRTPPPRFGRARPKKAQAKPSGKSSGAKAATPPTRITKTKKPRDGEPLDLNEVTFEQLRELGMSVTQATRVIAYREREGGFTSPDDLATVPGISKAFLSELRDQLTA